MVATRTSTKKTSRERARARRIELDAARAERDAAVEAAAASFFDADDSRAELAERIRRIDTDCAAAVATLVGLKEPNSRIAALLEITTAEVRRLRELVEASADPSATMDVTAEQDAETEQESEHGAAEGSDGAVPGNGFAAERPTWAGMSQVGAGAADAR